MTTLDQALMLAERFPVFPCRADTKAPVCGHGFKDASRDPAAVRALWREHPGPLIGVPTGEASGFDALDVDPRHGGMAWLDDAREALPFTRINHTRSGGLHFLFRHAQGVKNSEGKIAPGVDTRGAGGYVIWWPAAGCRADNKGLLADWPRWLLRIMAPPPRRAVVPAVAVTKAEADARAALLIERAFARVRNAAPGQRHYQLRAAAATLGGLQRFLGASPAVVEAQLVALSVATGDDQASAERTARWALEKGALSPLLTG